MSVLIPMVEMLGNWGIVLRSYRLKIYQSAVALARLRLAEWAAGRNVMCWTGLTMNPIIYYNNMNVTTYADVMTVWLLAWELGALRRNANNDYLSVASGMLALLRLWEGGLGLYA